MHSFAPLPVLILLVIGIGLATAVPRSWYINIPQNPPHVQLTTEFFLSADDRSSVLSERAQAVQQADRIALSRAHAKLAGDAFARAGFVTDYWLNHRDTKSGLFPTRLAPGYEIWTYEDAASDLFPFLAIGTRLLVPGRYPEILATLAAERAYSPGFPRDVPLAPGVLANTDEEKHFTGATEYAKDGLLPLIEILGPDPWLDRLREITDRFLEVAATPTPDGVIVSNSTEINGNVLQVLSRLYWQTRDARYLEMGNRVAAAYLDHQIPRTDDLPVQRWDFMQDEPVGPRRFFLGDHGNEIVSGLIEWHRVEILTQSPNVTRHRDRIRKLLDRLITRGRTVDGLWVELIDVPSGRVRDPDFTDNWGYLAQSYLHQAQIERSYPGGDVTIAERYEAVAQRALQAASRTGEYPWDAGTMDGYADTIESALYVLRWLKDPEAVSWVHDAVGTLMKFQQDDGRVTDENIDGNFIRSSLLYGLWLTQGVQADPWQPGLNLGAVRDGGCLQVHADSPHAWSGSLKFDTPRYASNFRLPTDYPRLNQWMEWFTVDLHQSYATSMDGGVQQTLPGSTLSSGIPLQLAAGEGRDLRVCAA